MPVVIKNLTPATLQEVKRDKSLLTVFLGKGEPISMAHLITTDDYTIKKITASVSNFSLDVTVTMQISYNNGTINMAIIPPGNWTKWEGEVVANKDTSITIYTSYPATSSPPQNMYVILDMEREK